MSRLTDEQVRELIKTYDTFGQGEAVSRITTSLRELLELRAVVQKAKSVMLYIDSQNEPAEIWQRCATVKELRDALAAKEQVEAMNLKASIEAYDAMDEQEQG
jgi:hypothetical protein